MRGEFKAALLAVLFGLLAVTLEVFCDQLFGPLPVTNDRPGSGLMKALLSPRALPHYAALVLFVAFGLLTARVLSRRRRAQDTLRTSCEHYGQIFTEAADGVWALDLDGRIESVNTSLTDLAGMPADELVGRHCHEILNSPLCHTTHCPLKIIVNGEKFVERDVLVTRKDERNALCLLAAHALRDGSGELIGVVEGFRNLTEQRAMEARFQALIETTGDGITIIDPDTVITYANRAFCSMLKMPLDGILGRKGIDLCVPDCAHVLLSQVRHRQTGARGTYDLEFLDSDGQPVSVLVTATPLYDEAGGFAGGFAVMKDVTQQKRDAKRMEHLNSVLRAVRNVNQLITRERDQERLLQQACECLIETRGYHFAAVMLLEDDAQLTATYGAGLSGDLARTCQEALDRGLWDMVQQPDTPQPVLLGRQAQDWGEGFEGGSHDGHECLAMRLEYAGRRYGAVIVSVPSEMAESEEEHGLFDEVTGDLAFALYALGAEAERKRYQKTLAAERDRWHRMLNAARVLILGIDAQGKATYFSPYCEALTGYTHEEVADRPFWEVLVSKREMETVRQGFYRLWQGQTIPQVEDHWVCKDGHEILTSWRSTAIVDTTGATRELIAIGLDITEHRAAELAVHESEERYRTLFNGGEDAIFLFDLAADGVGNILEANDVACRRYGHSRDQLLRMTPAGLHASEDQADLAGVLDQLHRKGHALFEQLHMARDGHRIPVEVNAHLIEFDERPAVLAIVRDISERKETAARLAHLNSVLMAIRNVNQLITRVTDREQLLQQACECLIETRGYQLACIAMMDTESAPGVTYTASHGDTLVSVNEDAMVRLYKLLSSQTGEPSPLVLTPEQMQWTERLRSEAAAGRTIMAIRLDYAEHRYGLLAVSVEREMALDSDEQGLFAEVADDIAFALYAIETAAEREHALEQLELAQFSVARASNGVFWTDEASRILYANDAALQKLGYSLDEIRTLTLESIDSGAPAELWDAYWQDLRANGSATFETTHRTRDGREFPVEVSANYLSFKGREYNFSFARDISIRRAAAERLRALKEQYELLVESQLVQTFIVQGDRIIFANQTMHRQLGYEPGELVGKYVLEPVAPELREAVTDWHRRMQAGELETNELETRVLTKQGTLRWVRIWLQGISDFGGSSVLIGHMVDTTEERELRNQLEHSQRLESLGTLAGGVAHEFNNVLQAILLNASLLQVERDFGESEGDKLKTIIERTEYGARLTDQLLTFSRRAPVQIGPLNLSTVVEETRRLLERTMPRHVRLHCQLEPQLWTIQGDSGRLKQILINLALNARDAITGEGHLTFETQNVVLSRAALKTMQKLQPGPHVLLKVTDDGLGMDPQVASRAFEPFFTTKGVGQGTGLGLSIVHGIVDTHAGYIKLDSRPGQGTTFHIYFPAHPQSTIQAFSHAATVPQGGGDETILVVDDEPEVVRVAEEALTRFGYTVLSASGGDQALQIATDNPGKLDLVLLDLVMPGISGQETFALLRAQAPDLRVVFASGYMPDSDRGEGPAAPDGYLDKPFNLDRLLQTVRSVLDSR